MKTGLFDDAPVYLGQCLPNDRKVHGVILFASWSLTNIERRYSKKKKEALALVWTCERFSMCMSGQSFELETDHKLLEPIHSRSSKPSARIERWVFSGEPSGKGKYRKRLMETTLWEKLIVARKTTLCESSSRIVCRLPYRQGRSATCSDAKLLVWELQTRNIVHFLHIGEL